MIKITLIIIRGTYYWFWLDKYLFNGFKRKKTMVKDKQSWIIKCK
jgi:hypothetical protein